MNQETPRFLHERPDWPQFHWDHEALSEVLADVNYRRGGLIVAMDTLGFESRQESVLSVLVQDVQRSSEIEGVRLAEALVRSSIARRLGMDAGGLPGADRNVEGVVEMMLDATQNYTATLDATRIFGWHAALFPSGWSGMHHITVAAWRDGPMQVVSGPMGREQVHFEAPAAGRVDGEMRQFLKWFENGRLDPVLKAAIAHLWFVTIHPLDDGNGRIGRAVMDMALARADRTPQRFYSMSAQFLAARNSYYDVLEATQRGSLDITRWLDWFLGRLRLALDSAEGVLRTVKQKHEFWDAHSDMGLNERQTKVVNMLLDGFNGKLRTEKYAKITKVANRTALRDLDDLVEKGILRSVGGGRSTSYELIVRT